MTLENIRDELISANLHKESVERMLDHYKDMRFHLRKDDYVEAGAHIGNFCENVANILLDEVGEGPDPHVSVGNVVDNITNGHYDTKTLSSEVYLTVPRMLRAVYDIRNNRDSVHVNLQIRVNRSDTKTAVRISGWILTEFLREFGNEDDVDQIATQIENLSAPLSTYIDSYNGNRVIMSRELTVREEILIHLYAHRKKLDVDKLSDWIIDAPTHRVKSRLGNLKQARMVHYEDDMTKITVLGAKEAETVIDEHFENGISSVQ